MKTKLFLLFAFVVYSFAPILANNAKNDTEYHEKEKTLKTSKNEQKTGYYVLIKKCSDISELKTESIYEAEKFIQSFYPEFCENLEYQFRFSPYYRVLAFEKEIYIEKMKITKSGKYKRIKNYFKTK